MSKKSALKFTMGMDEIEAQQELDAVDTETIDEYKRTGSTLPPNETS
jgi:hypothetical protein